MEIEIRICSKRGSGKTLIANRLITFLIDQYMTTEDKIGEVLRQGGILDVKVRSTNEEGGVLRTEGTLKLEPPQVKITRTVGDG